MALKDLFVYHAWCTVESVLDMSTVDKLDIQIVAIIWMQSVAMRAEIALRVNV